MTLKKNARFVRAQTGASGWRERHPEINDARQKAFVAVPATDHHRA